MGRPKHPAARIERLESLIKRKGGGGGGGAPAGTVLVVPNIAALIAYAATPLTDGRLVWVQTVRDYWEFSPSAPNVPVDGITCVPTSAGGTSRWLRTLFADATWRIGHDTWHVNPVTGNDENFGDTALTALQTFAEWARRLGDGPVQQTTEPINLAINLFIDADVPPGSTDQLVIRPVFAPDTALRIFGGVSAVLRTGTVTGYTAQVPGLNQPAQFDDAAFLGAWELGERLRITTPGPSFNATCQIQNDLGGGSCNVSVPAYGDESTFTTVPTALFPAVGDDYAVERLRRVPVGFTKPIPSVWPSGYLPIVDFVDCLLVPVSPFSAFQDLNYIEGEGSQVFSLVLYQCIVDIAASLRGVIGVNSFFRGNLELRQTAQLNGGGAWVPVGTPAYILFTAHDGFSALDYNFQSWGLALTIAAPGSLGSFAVFNAVASFLNPSGHGVRVGNASAFLPPTKARLRGLCWGAGNFGVGLHVAATSSLEASATPTITGGAGDCSTYDLLQCRPFDDAVGAYTAVPIPPSWAAFVVAVGAGGFGLNMHNVAHDSHLLVNAAP